MGCKNGIEEVYTNITGKQTFADKEENKMIAQWNSEDRQRKEKRKK